jgi:hypothetical protein
MHNCDMVSGPEDTVINKAVKFLLLLCGADALTA